MFIICKMIRCHNIEKSTDLLQLSVGFLILCTVTIFVIVAA